tara:strand:+ start:1897 stop:2232 length:336 start_codon:yes stop_codon:yes gene_type:complete
MSNKKTEVSSITPEELLTRVKSILQVTIKEVLKPEPEEYIGVKEVADFVGESTSWVYQKCGTGFLPHYKTGKNASLKFKKSEVNDVIEKHRIESHASVINYSIDNEGNIIS